MTILTLTKVDVGMMEDVGTSANQLVQLDSNAKIPAVDGSLLTGITSGVSSSSDPTISTNPSGGVGTKFTNTTDGEIFICTDATAGANVWTNVGEGTGDVWPWSYPVSTYGYMAGGDYPGAGFFGSTTNIERFSTVSDANATAWADLVSVGRSSPSSGQRSVDYGYVCGGGSPSANYTAMDKWPFASQTNSTDVGDLTQGRGGATGASSGTYVYTVGGGGGFFSNVIDKVSVATDGNAVDVGDITNYHSQGYSNSSTDNGYNSGGYAGSPSPAGDSNVINKFSFTTDANATDIGDLTAARAGRISSSSLTHGYCAQGSPTTDRIDKFTFASDNNSTDVGNALNADDGSGGCASSLNYGYNFSGTYVNHINKWSHTTDGNATDVADVVRSRGNCAGTHG